LPASSIGRSVNVTPVPSDRILARNLLIHGYLTLSSGRTMAVSPDLLLNIKTPEPRGKAAGAKADSASQASRQEASRFAEMYAKERQGKPMERARSEERRGGKGAG